MLLLRKLKDGLRFVCFDYVRDLNVANITYCYVVSKSRCVGHLVAQRVERWTCDQ